MEKVRRERRKRKSEGSRRQSDELLPGTKVWQLTIVWAIPRALVEQLQAISVEPLNGALRVITANHHTGANHYLNCLALDQNLSLQLKLDYCV